MRDLKETVIVVINVVTTKTEDSRRKSGDQIDWMNRLNGACPFLLFQKKTYRDAVETGFVVDMRRIHTHDLICEE